MALQVIGAGFGRTGTWSTYAALNQLGFPCYHMIEVLRNKQNASHLDFWHKVAEDPPGTQQNWDEVFARYSAAVDNPACCVWRELAVAYPDAKVLLTLHPRGADAWYESTIDTIYFTENKWQFKLLARLVPMWRKFGAMSHKLIWQRTLEGTMDDRERAIARYNRLVDDVKSAVPADRLLVYSVDQGWEPLCQFLGVPVPETPFPNLNDRAAIKKMIAQMILVAYAMLAGYAALLLLVAYGLYRLIH